MYPLKFGGYKKIIFIYMIIIPYKNMGILNKKDSFLLK